MKKSFCLNYFCLAFVFISIIFLTGCSSTPENTLQEFKKAVDKKDGNKIWSLLSSKIHKIYNDPEGMALDRKTFKGGKKMFIDFEVESIHDLPNAGKPLEIESVKISKNKAVIFVKDNPNSFTLVKEFGSWKLSMVGEDDIFSVADCFLTPQDTLNDFKKALDSKDGFKMMHFLSSDDSKYYRKIIEDEKAKASKNPDKKKNLDLLLEKLGKAIAKDFWVKVMKDSPDSPKLGKEFKVKNFTRKSEDKVVVFLEDNPNGITFVKELGTWKLSIWRRTVKEEKTTK